MPIPNQKKYTADEFFKIVPETNQLYELLEGEIVAQAAPSRAHQRLSREISHSINSYIKSKNGKCEVFYAPFDVKLDDKNVVQPDIFVVCDPDMTDELRCNGAPDFIIEIVSTNRYDDFFRKLKLYKDFGVREYWIVDPKNRRTIVYSFENDDGPYIYTFEQPIPVGIYGGELSITIADIL